MMRTCAAPLVMLLLARATLGATPTLATPTLAPVDIQRRSLSDSITYASPTMRTLSITRNVTPSSAPTPLPTPHPTTTAPTAHVARVARSNSWVYIWKLFLIYAIFCFALIAFFEAMRGDSLVYGSRLRVYRSRTPGEAPPPRPR